MESAGTYELLKQARERFTQREIADRLGVSKRTVVRWENQETTCPPIAGAALSQLLNPKRILEEPSPGYDEFTFIDLFAGIGGIRLGFENAGGRCVFTSEWNEFAKKTYIENFGDEHPFVGDIVPYPAELIPDHDVLLGGFPCQPFSIAGVSKKNALGRPHGFECTTQGTLFFDVERIIATKRPKAFLLENVKNLRSHDGGNTFRVIMDTLENKLGYKVQTRIIDGQHFVPQHRERILIVGFREDTGFDFEKLTLPPKNHTMASVLHPEDGSEEPDDKYTFGPDAKVHEKYILSDKLWNYLQNYAAKHRAAGNGFGYGLVKPESVARTLSARYYKDGSEILVYRGEGQNPRRLTPRECARLMGFPDSFRIPVSDTQAYKQFGNSVVVPVMEAVAKAMKPHIQSITSLDRIREMGQQPLPILV